MFSQVVTKKRVVLSKRFKCPFCANDDVVECEMKHREGTGSLKCRMCDASFQMPIHHLHEPIDVFSEWLDECEAAEKRSHGVLHDSVSAIGSAGVIAGVGAGTGGGGGGMRNSNNAVRQGYEYDSEEDDDDLGESSGLGAKQNQNQNHQKQQSQKQQHSRNSLGLGDSDDDDSD